MKILTFNMALLDFKIFGFRILRPTKYLELRMSIIPDKIIALDADVVCLQEVYKTSHKRKLEHTFSKHYPYCFYKKSNTLLGFDNGLMILSKNKFDSLHFERLISQPFEESLLSKKGLINVCLQINGIKYTITNTHTTASGGGFQQDNARVEALRDSQISQIINSTERIKKENNSDCAIICGDFNCGPQVSESNYALVLYKGYVDTFKINNSEEFPTWDPDNILNQDSPVFKASPKQRIDFIFCDKHSIEKFSEIKSKIVFTESLIEVEEKNIPLSDHYGVFTEMN